MSGSLFETQCIYICICLSQLQTCVLYFTENALAERMVYRMFLLGGNFVASLICTLKSKKIYKKPLKTFKT